MPGTEAVLTCLGIFFNLTGRDPLNGQPGNAEVYNTTACWSKLCNNKLQRFYTVQRNCGRLWSVPIKGFKWKLEMQSAVKNAHENSLIHFQLSCCRIVFKDGVVFILCFSCLADKCKIWQLMSNILSCSLMLASFHKAFVNITMLKHYHLTTINYWEIVWNFVCTRFIIPIVYLNMLQSK